MVSFKITAGQKRQYFVAAYVPPNDQTILHWVEEDLADGPAWVETLLVNDLNARLAQPQDQHEDDSATTSASYRLVDQTVQLIPRRRYRGKGSCSWRIWRYGMTITGRGD